MDAGAIAGCFRDKSILITGSTGFLGKVLVEKMLRVQPDVKKLYLLVRAPDASSAEQRVYTKVLGNDLFNTLREKHGPGFQSFIKEKLVPLAGDIIYADFGLEKSVVYELSEKIDVIVNVAATTNFYERYDVALTSNVLGARHACEFAKKCTNLKMFLHVSTAYVAGEQEGLILERPFLIGEAMKAGTILDIEAEFKLVDKMKTELVQHSDPGRLHQLEKAKMKDLGLNRRAKHFGWPNVYVFTKAMGEMLLGHLRGDLPVVIVRPSMVTSIYRDPLPGWIQGIRTIDTIIDGYGKRALPCFIGEDNVIIDVIPGDMVVNAMMVAMVTHWNEHAQIIYHVSSSLRNPLTYSTLLASVYHYFSAKLRLEKTGRTIQYKRLFLFNKYVPFYVYMFLLYRLSLEIFHILSAGLFSEHYNRQKRSYYLAMLTAKLYAPYAFFKGCFDDSNAERLRVVTGKNDKKTNLFDFDPRSIDWDMYFYFIHIPGLLKYAKK